MAEGNPKSEHKLLHSLVDYWDTKNLHHLCYTPPAVLPASLCEILESYLTSCLDRLAFLASESTSHLSTRELRPEVAKNCTSPFELIWKDARLILLFYMSRIPSSQLSAIRQPPVTIPPPAKPSETTFIGIVHNPGVAVTLYGFPDAGQMTQVDQPTVVRKSLRNAVKGESWNPLERWWRGECLNV
ncbi:hypothetical protein L804_06168 [Cryptococcus deuterogattii 2001/935-1]|nr:hypothetical protein L804_06168 [Cryptococcus deuterogattii 2001/935-1]